LHPVKPYRWYRGGTATTRHPVSALAEYQCAPPKLSHVLGCANENDPDPPVVPGLCGNRVRDRLRVGLRCSSSEDVRRLPWPPVCRCRVAEGRSGALGVQSSDRRACQLLIPGGRSRPGPLFTLPSPQFTWTDPARASDRLP